MIRWVRDTVKAIWFFFKFVTILAVGYLLLLGLLWLLRHPTLAGMTQSSAVAADFWGRVETAVKAMGGVFLVTWSLHLLDQFFLRGRLAAGFGLVSRGSFSLLSIFTFPFVHGSYLHLLGNTPLLLLFGGLAILVLPTITILVEVLLFIFLIQGVGVWLFGARNGRTIGASGLVLAFYGFDVAHGLFAGGWVTVIALALLFLFGRRMFRVLLSRGKTVEGAQISMAAHLWGFLSGVFAAYLISPFGPLGVG
jgi:membrane associated rhomboid family serine protease